MKKILVKRKPGIFHIGIRYHSRFIFCASWAWNHVCSYRKSQFFHYTMSSSDLPKLLRTSVKPVHKCYLCAGSFPIAAKNLEWYLIGMQKRGGASASKSSGVWGSQIRFIKKDHLWCTVHPFCTAISLKKNTRMVNLPGQNFVREVDGS